MNLLNHELASLPPVLSEEVVDGSDTGELLTLKQSKGGPIVSFKNGLPRVHPQEGDEYMC